MAVVGIRAKIVKCRGPVVGSGLKQQLWCRRRRRWRRMRQSAGSKRLRRDQRIDEQWQGGIASFSNFLVAARRSRQRQRISLSLVLSTHGRDSTFWCFRILAATTCSLVHCGVEQQWRKKAQRVRVKTFLFNYQVKLLLTKPPIPIKSHPAGLITATC